MLVSAAPFFVFLVAVCLLYWAAAGSRRMRLVVLAAANLFFLARFSLIYLALPVAASVDFLVGLGFARWKGKGARRLLVSVSLLLNLGLLAALKVLPLVTAGRLGWLFTLSLSFYCFQSLTYTLDLYQGEIQPTRSYLTYIAGALFFPSMTAGSLPHKFSLTAHTLRALIDRTKFAISTEETRYYLNGIYLHHADSEGTPVLRAVATDGHRLARVEEPLPAGASAMPGVIIPRKTVNELRKLLDEVTGNVEIALSDTRIQFRVDSITLTSKLIDGTFPEYERVIPRDNDKVLRVGKKDFADAVARVAAISSERSRPVKLSLARDLLVLSASSPEQGTATEELDAEYVKYDFGPLEIGFQARYLNDITDQIAGDVEFRFSDGGAPTVVRDASDASALYVLMPMRV